MLFDTLSGRQKFIYLFIYLQLFVRAASLGGDHSLVVRPITTTHAQMTPEDKADSGIVENLVRISVGLEDVADLIQDLEMALEKATGLRSFQ